MEYIYIIEGFYMHSDGSWIEAAFFDRAEALIECNRLTDKEEVEGDRLYCVREVEVR